MKGKRLDSVRVLTGQPNNADIHLRDGPIGARVVRGIGPENLLINPHPEVSINHNIAVSILSFLLVSYNPIHLNQISEYCHNLPLINDLT